MTKHGTISVLLVLAGCTASVADPPTSSGRTAGTAQPVATETQRAGTETQPSGEDPGPPPVDPPFAGYSAAAVRDSVERLVAWRFGEEALRLARSAPSSILVTHHQGLPRPVRQPDGSWGYEPPGVNAIVRGGAGWSGWSGRTPRAVAAARAAEIDRILADPAFWAEPDHVAPTCTDAGARRMVVRHRGRTAVRQQGCGGQGITNRLWELAFGAPG